MKKRYIPAFTVMFVTLLFVAYVLSRGDAPKTINQAVDFTTQSEVTMDIVDYKYSQPNIRIKKGTKVTWTNQDTVQHNVMLEHEGADKAHDPPSREQVDPNKLAGPLLEKGESYSFTFNEVTINPYHCSPHPYMIGSVTVVE